MHTPKNILVATDFSELGQLAVDTAFALADKLDSKVHLVHVFTLQDASETPSLAFEAMQNAELSEKRKLSAIADRFCASGRVGEVKTRNGEPAPMILLTAEEVDADLIVLGTSGRHGLGRLILGSTAESVLRQARCPVWVAKQHVEHAKNEAASKAGAVPVP